MTAQPRDRLDAMLAQADTALAEADQALARDYPGPRPGRQPVHTVYLPADRFEAAVAARWGRQAIKVLETWAPGPAHARLVRRSLERGFYQGWDLHPAQLASRHAATFGFFREGLPAAAARLRANLGPVPGGAPGRVLEEPATARALAGFLGRGLDCGAVTEAELADLVGLDRPGLDALR